MRVPRCAQEGFAMGCPAGNGQYPNDRFAFTGQQACLQPATLPMAAPYVECHSHRQYGNNSGIMGPHGYSRPTQAFDQRMGSDIAQWQLRNDSTIFCLSSLLFRHLAGVGGTNSDLFAAVSGRSYRLQLTHSDLKASLPPKICCRFL